MRCLHLGKPTAQESSYPLTGGENAVVGNPRFVDNKVWINATQYFDNVPESVWEFPVGGYQPAEKWLKERRGKLLSYADVRHYQWILHVLDDTAKIMASICMRL